MAIMLGDPASIITLRRAVSHLYVCLALPRFARFLFAATVMQHTIRDARRQICAAHPHMDVVSVGADARNDILHADIDISIIRPEAPLKNDILGVCVPNDKCAGRDYERRFGGKAINI